MTPIHETPLDSKYLLAKTTWKMRFKKSAGLEEKIDTFATYVLERKGSTLAIVFQIDHQDLTAKVKEVKELGLATQRLTRSSLLKSANCRNPPFLTQEKAHEFSYLAWHDRCHAFHESGGPAQVGCG